MHLDRGSEYFGLGVCANSVLLPSLNGASNDSGLFARELPGRPRREEKREEPSERSIKQNRTVGYGNQKNKSHCSLGSIVCGE